MVKRVAKGPNEAEVERAHDMLLKFISMARQLRPVDGEALINRLRVDLMINDFSRERRRLYRSAIDYFEDILDERLSKVPETRADTKRATRSYITRFLEAVKE